MAAWKRPILRLLKVPPEPEDPSGDEGSLRVFRAAPGFFHYKLALWGIGQGFSLLGLIVVVGLELSGVFSPFEWFASREVVLGLVALTIAAFVFQTLFSLAVVRLDYELRWYKVTDTSLRIREGVVQVREMTMTFANIQNLSITQGPFQRLLGIADLKVQSAGGGGSASTGQKKEHPGALDMHTAYFRGIDNAEELRDLMRHRLRAARDAGLGDPDDESLEPGLAAAPPSPAPAVAVGPASRLALADLLSEAAGLRHAVERWSAG